MSDQEIITLLQNDPEQGMEQIVERYTGLLWSVAGQLLQEPEDVKDCVNETFGQFYSQREEFDPAKGSLKGYLAVIIRRLAMKKRQDNRRRAGETFVDAEDTDGLRSLEQKEELDAYLRTLDAVDEQIIRMKYYGGMTAKEIAASLGLPYETVKKRHQRSLKKLRKAMLIGLIVIIAAVLAACAYTVLRHFGVVPGYGISTDPTGVYVLEETVTVEGGSFHAAFTDAWWMNGVLTVDAMVTVIDTSPAPAPNDVHAAGEWDFKQMTVKGVEQPEYLVGIADGSAGDRYRQLYQCSLPEGTKDTLTLTFVWENGDQCTLTLKRAESEVSYEQAGYYDLTEQDGGLLAVPRLENGELIVAIYPLNEGDYVIDPLLNRGSWSSYDPKHQDITVTAADGTVLTGQPVYAGFHSSADYLEWNFGPAGPGEYTLNVPYVYEMLAEGAGQPVSREIALTTEGRDLDVTFPIVNGAARLTRVEPVDYVYAIDAQTDEVKALNEVYARFRWWDIDTECISTDPERTVAGFSYVLTIPADVVPIEVNGALLGVERAMELVRTESVGDGTAQRVTGLRVGTLEEASVELTLDPQYVGYRWNHEFNIEFEVSETE